MALRLPRSIFIHIPRTGGYWIREALTAANVPTNMCIGSLPTEDIAHRIQHSPLKNIVDQEVPTFAFVRHPCTWVQSFWVFQMKSGKRFMQDKGQLTHIFSENFEEFIENLIEKKPGYISRMYKSFLCDGKRTVTHIGKKEHLVDDTVRILRSIGEQFDEDLLRSVPPKNVYMDPEWQMRALFHSRELYQRLIESEIDAIHRFGYTHIDGCSSSEISIFSHTENRRYVGAASLM